MVKKGGVSDLIGLTNSNYARDIGDSKSTSTYVLMMVRFW